MKKEQTPLEAAAELLEQYGCYALKVQPITEASERDWIESCERCYRLADYNDARAARLAAVATTTGGAGSSTRIASTPKAKRQKKAAPGTGTAAMFEVVREPTYRGGGKNRIALSA